MAALQGKVAQQLQDASKRLKPRLKRSFSDTALRKKELLPLAAGGSRWHFLEVSTCEKDMDW